MTKRLSTIYACCILVVASFFMFYRLGDASIGDWDEGIYTIIAYEQLGNLSLIPTIFGDVWLEKPPAGFWLHALGMELFGINAFGVRFMGSLAMVGSFLLFYALAKRWYTSTIAFATTLILIVSPFWYHHHMSRTGDLEMYFLFFLLLAVYVYVRSWQKKEWLWLACVSMAAAFFVRGYIAFLPAAAIGLHAIVTQKMRWYGWPTITGVIGLFIALIVPWHVYLWLMEPERFVNMYIKDQFLGRLTGPLQGHAGTWRYYFDFLQAKISYLWYIFLLAGGYSVYLAIRKRDERTWLLILLVGINVAALQLMPTKLPWYVHSIIPFLYLTCVPLFVDMGKLLSRRFSRRAVFILGVSLASIYILFTGASAWRYISNPLITSVERTVAVVQAEGLENRQLVAYNVEGWYQGHLAPAAHVHWRLSDDYQAFYINDDLAARVYVPDPSYTVFVTNLQGARTLRLLDPESPWRFILADKHVVAIRE